MVRITDIINQIRYYNPDADLDLVNKAYIYSARVHAGQVRLSGEPYLSHPLAVAFFLAEVKLDAVSIAAGLLHDVIEDTHTTKEDITSMFGEEVCYIVEGVTKLSALKTQTAKAMQAENLRKMILAMADDIRVILIKIADRVHNMRTLRYHRKESKIRRICRETLDIYAPITARLGMNRVKIELQDLAFKHLNPVEYDQIRYLVSKNKQERDEYVTTVQAVISQEMEKHGLRATVFGRYKNFYSIHKKMEEQSLTFDELYDIVAFRIILDTTAECYKALGIVHEAWKPIPMKFADYIGNPKPNMYQSLHTGVVGLHKERVEIQIRTVKMDEVAQSGIAAHWSYKEGRTADESATKTFAWIQNLVENQATFNDPDEFMENVKIDLFPDEVYVFTPAGEVKAFPIDATPVDFAYSIHTEVGEQCAGAKIDGRLVPLKHKLQTGNIVEIITKKGQKPSKDWLGFVKTVKARSRIRQFIKTQERERSLSLGREMCEKTFRKKKLNFAAVLKSDEMVGIMEYFGFKSQDELIVNVGYGKTTPNQILKKYTALTGQEDESDSFLDKVLSRVKKKRQDGGVIVKGLEDILIKYAKCCRPVPGDRITGYITRGQGVTIHRVQCVNAVTMDPARRIEATWADESSERYPVRLKLHSYDRMGLLADMTAIITKNKANIISLTTKTLENATVETFLSVSVENVKILEKLIAELKKVKHIHDVERTGGD